MRDPILDSGNEAIFTLRTTGPGPAGSLPLDADVAYNTIFALFQSQRWDDVVARAKAAHVPCVLITDAGKTEFHGVATKTCCAVGPAWAEDVDAITGTLSLL